MRDRDLSEDSLEPLQPWNRFQFGSCYKPNVTLILRLRPHCGPHDEIILMKQLTLMDRLWMGLHYIKRLEEMSQILPICPAIRLTMWGHLSFSLQRMLIPACNRYHSCPVYGVLDLPASRTARKSMCYLTKLPVFGISLYGYQQTKSIAKISSKMQHLWQSWTTQSQEEFYQKPKNQRKTGVSWVGTEGRCDWRSTEQKVWGGAEIPSYKVLMQS